MNLETISRTLDSIGYTLEIEQPHISGERFLMSNGKLVLVARRKSDGKRVVIKVSNTEEGKKDIKNEKRARNLLKSVRFADKAILFPEEIYWGEHDGRVIWALEFIEQKMVFVTHTLEEQFFIALKAFEAQEAFHATTYEHLETVRRVFPILYAQDYSKEFASCRAIFAECNHNPLIEETLGQAEAFLRSEKTLINEYSNYLTHTDFVPHNFRIKSNQLYMLDCAPEYRTVHFGNKYEGWARFINYMVIHNPALEQALVHYIRENRGEEEFLNLRLMRVYKIGFLLKFYAESLKETFGDLRELTLKRISFWHEVLKFILDDKEIPQNLVEEYKAKRDKLRSEDEKKRQREFAVA